MASSLAQSCLELHFVGRSSKRIGYLTGAGGSLLWSWSSDNRVFQLEPSRSPEPGILPEPALRAGFGNQVFYRSCGLGIGYGLSSGTNGSGTDAWRFPVPIPGTAVSILNLESGRTGEPAEPPKPMMRHLKPFAIVVLNGKITVYSVDSPNGFEW